MRTLVTTLLLLMLSLSAFAAPRASSDEITPQALIPILQSNARRKLLILNVGPRVIFAQAHIEGAEYIGPASDPRGIARLRERMKGVPKNKSIILYCGCCPWDKCPNIHPALAELKKLHFTNVKILHIANNFGTDWVDKDYPVARGQ